MRYLRYEIEFHLSSLQFVSRHMNKEYLLFTSLYNFFFDILLLFLLFLYLDYVADEQ